MICHDEVYLDLLRDILKNGEGHADRTGVGTLSVFGRQLRFANIQLAFPLLTTKKLPMRWIAEELRWFLSGSSNEKDLRAAGVDIWREWATAAKCAEFGREEGDLGPIYGKLWREFPVGNVPNEAAPDYLDQIAELLGDIMTTPNSRRLIVTGWHPYYQRRVALPPCHTLWQVKVHPSYQTAQDKRDYGDSTAMSLHLYARSIDAFLGLPFNIASYALLLQVLCAHVGMRARDLIISFGDVHIYKNHLKAVEEQLSRKPYASPALNVTGTVLKFEYQWWDGREYVSHPKISAEVAI